MSHYYFLVSSLPYLNYDMEKIPPMEYFLKLCREHTSGNDYDLIKSAVMDDCGQKATSSGILNKWYTGERNLRNKLVILRARKKGVDPERYLRPNPDLSVYERTAQEAFQEDSPLAAENLLNRERWHYLDELELGHYFDTDELIIYYLKLQILWRKMNFDREKGMERYNEIIEKFSGEEFPREDNVNQG